MWPPLWASENVNMSSKNATRSRPTSFSSSVPRHATYPAYLVSISGSIRRRVFEPEPSAAMNKSNSVVVPSAKVATTRRSRGRRRLSPESALPSRNERPRPPPVPEREDR